MSRQLSASACRSTVSRTGAMSKSSIRSGNSSWSVMEMQNPSSGAEGQGVVKPSEESLVLFVLDEARLGEIGEAGELRLEGELDGAGRSVTLLGDDHVGRALDL